MNINVIVLDLDGTVLHDDKSISDYTISILNRCKEKGIQIVVATARSEKAAERYIKKIAPDVIIANGGSLVRYKGEVIFECRLRAKIIDSIICEIMNHKDFVSVTAETDKGYYVSWETADVAEYAHAIHYDFTTPLSQDVYKITVELKSTDCIYYIQEKYPECGVISFSDMNWYRIANKDATKMNAIRALANYFQVELSGIVAFGDDYSDLEMIRDCGIGVAMKNGISEIKAIADCICETNNDDGVAKWLENSLLLV